MFNKKLIVSLLLICLTVSMLSGCSKNTEPASGTTAPETTAAPVETTQTPAVSAALLDHIEETGSLMAWEMSASVWSSSNGANITFTAIPREYVQGQSASFVVRLDGKEVANKSCTWDGTCYTGYVELEAADGYEYECILFPPQGVGEHFTLSDSYDALVYMKSSLAAYCNLYISDFKVENNLFVVTAGFASVQLPQLTTEGTTVDFRSAQLIFQLNGNTVETQDISLPKGEGVGSHETSLSSISFAMPEMADDYQLDLMLTVTLSNGEELTAPGGSWFFNNGELRMAAG